MKHEYTVFEVAGDACALLGSFPKRLPAQCCANEVRGRDGVFRVIYKDGAYDGGVAGKLATNDEWAKATHTVQRMRMEKSQAAPAAGGDDGNNARQGKTGRRFYILRRSPRPNWPAVSMRPQPM